MDKAKASGVEFAFLRMNIFLPLSLASVGVFGSDEFGDGKESVELCQGGW